MATIKRFEDLSVWQTARKLSRAIFEKTKHEGFAKNFTLRDQILRSSGSTMDNIAEGFEREGNREFIQYLSIAKGSCGETRSQVYRAYDFEYLQKDEFEELKTDCETLSKELSGFMNYLKNSNLKGNKFAGR